MAPNGWFHYNISIINRVPGFRVLLELMQTESRCNTKCTNLVSRVMMDTKRTPREKNVAIKFVKLLQSVSRAINFVKLGENLETDLSLKRVFFSIFVVTFRVYKGGGDWKEDYINITAISGIPNIKMFCDNYPNEGPNNLINYLEYFMCLIEISRAPPIVVNKSFSKD